MSELMHPRQTAKRRSISGEASAKAPTDSLVELVSRLEEVKRQARALGLFTDDRDLLECPDCGLLEDVTAEGLLVTYPKDSKDLNDCGLRFRQLDEASFKCPACGARCKINLPTDEMKGEQAPGVQRQGVGYGEDGTS